MPRRPKSPIETQNGDDDSLKENAHLEPHSKPKNGKGRGREPQPAPHGSTGGLDADADGSSADEDAEQGSPKGRKRARVNEHGDARPMVNGHTAKGKGRAQPVFQPLPRHPDKCAAHSSLPLFYLLQAKVTGDVGLCPAL
jgi:hypothetical protein